MLFQYRTLGIKLSSLEEFEKYFYFLRSDDVLNELGRDVMIRIPSNHGIHIGLDPSFDSLNIRWKF